MKSIAHCINCGHDWTNLQYSAGDGITMMAFWCPSCEHKFAVIAEDQKSD